MENIPRALFFLLDVEPDCLIVSAMPFGFAFFLPQVLNRSRGDDDH